MEPTCGPRQSKIHVMTLNRVSLVGFCCLAACQAFGQADTLVQNGLTWLRSQPSLWVRVDGVDDYIQGNTFSADTFWYQSFQTGGPTAKLESTEYRNGRLIRRIVGDGNTLWAYDPLRNEYSAKVYGSLTGNQNQNLLRDLLTGFSSHATGNLASSARLVRETYGGGAALFRSWLTGGQSWALADPQFMNDPVVGSKWVYRASPVRQFAVYYLPGTPARSLSFQLDQNGKSGAWELTNIYGADASSVAGKDRLVYWHMTITPVLPATANFEFVPPANARPIVRSGG